MQFIHQTLMSSLHPCGIIKSWQGTKGWRDCVASTEGINFALFAYTGNGSFYPLWLQHKVETTELVRSNAELVRWVGFCCKWRRCRVMRRPAEDWRRLNRVIGRWSVTHISFRSKTRNNELKTNLLTWILLRTLLTGILKICSHRLPAGHHPGAVRVALLTGKAQKVFAALTGLVKNAPSSIVSAGEPRLTEISGLGHHPFSSASSQDVAFSQFGL